MEKKIDRFQQAAIDVDINAVVSAGAGSGKTTVLSERFSHLVMEKGYSVDQILTLTFTKEATVEMSSRIYKVLRDHNSPEAAKFYKANIKTIDSYCASVAKTGAHLYGISPDFSQSDDLKDKIAAMALPFILEHRDNESIKLLVDAKNYEEKALQIFVDPILKNSTVSEPIDFDKTLDFQIETIIKAWDEQFDKAEKVNSTLNNAIQSFDGNRGTKFFQRVDEMVKELELPAKHHFTKEEILAEKAELMDAAVEYFNQLGGISQTGAGKGTEEIKGALKTFRDIASVLESIANFVHGLPLSKALIPLLKEFQEKVNNYKRSSGELTFSDIASLAICILRDYPELRQLEKEKYKAIMIDEFQDDNILQRDLLFLLSERLDRSEKGIPSVENLCKDKLFFVGDEKQSIYRFRDADVSVFRGLSKDFREGNLSMTTNYRSKPALIASFNTIFGGYQYPHSLKGNNFAHTSVFYNEKNEEALKVTGKSVPDYEAIYHEVTMPEAVLENLNKMTNEQYLEEFEPHIHLGLYDNSQQEEDKQLVYNEEAEAHWIAKKIRKILSEGKYKPEDIAILFRDYAFQPMYERVLLSYGIPYNTQVVTGFFADGPANDIFAFLRLCVYPNDTQSYAQILRSPLMNLSIADVEAILNQKAEIFKADISFLDEESVRRYNHLKEAFVELVKTAKEGSVSKAVTMLWYNLGYRYETMWNQTVELYSKMYDLIFELCRQAEQNNLSLSEFVDSMNTYQNQGNRLEGLNMPLEQVNGVHLMTIFKSKGLEFPVVFLCETQKKSGNDSNTEPIYASKEYGLSINTPGKTNYFYNIVKELNGKMDSAELRRITYVALTRAKDQLYITNAKYQFDEDAEEKYSPGGTKAPATIWKILEPVFNHYFQDENAMKPFDLEMIEPQKREVDFESELRRNKPEEKILFLRNIENQNPFDSAEIIKKDVLESKYIKPSKLHKEDDETSKEVKIASSAEGKPVPYPEITRIVSKNPEKFGFTDFGTIAHSYMEALLNGEKAFVNAKAVAGLEDDKAAIETIGKVCTKMQEAFSASEIGKAAMASKWHKAEYEFRSKVGSKIIKGSVDLVFKNQDGTYTIVDYKSNQEVKPEIYYNQLACYRQAIASMLNVENPESIKCVLYYLRFNQTVDITKECSEVNIEAEIASLSEAL